MRVRKLDREDMHRYQKRLAQHIIDLTHCGLFVDMGLGKTVSTLTAIDALLYEHFAIDSVLVIAPKRVAENVWHTEVEDWTHLKRLKCVRVIGTAKQRLAALKEKGHIYLLGRDNVNWLIGQYGGSKLPFDMLVIDESSSFKNHKSMRFKALKRVQAAFERVVILTGTPAPNGLLDLWAQMYLLDRGERLGKFISTYREQFFRPNQRNGAIIYNYKIRKTGEQEIYERISDICVSMKAGDYLELPPKIDNYVRIPLPPKIQRQYDIFEKEQVLQLYDTEDLDRDIAAVNAAALSNKLLQFANGAVYEEENRNASTKGERKYHEVHDLKLKAVEDIVADAQGASVLIAWTYRHDMHRLMKHFKELSPRQLKNGKDIEDWCEGKIRMLMMHPASGGHGLNLQAGGHIVIWFGQTWSLELYKQFTARLHRQGQTKPTIIHHLIAENTMDQNVIDAINKKDITQEGLIAAVKYRVRKYLR